MLNVHPRVYCKYKTTIHITPQIRLTHFVNFNSDCHLFLCFFIKYPIYSHGKKDIPFVIPNGTHILFETTYAASHKAQIHIICTIVLSLIHNKTCIINSPQNSAIKNQITPTFIIFWFIQCCIRSQCPKI